MGVRDYACNAYSGMEIIVCRDSTNHRSRLPVSLLLAVALLLNVAPAFATLGEGVASIDADQQALHAELRVDRTGAYFDYVLQLPHGLTVNEFVNSAGVVFEVTWSGKGRRPDMRQLLGAYFEYLNTPVDHARSRSRRVEVSGPQVVIHSQGYARFFKGSAYVPGLLPASLSGPIPVPAHPE